MNTGHRPDSEAELDFDNAVYQSNKRRIFRRRPKAVRDLVNSIIARRGIAAEQSNQRLQLTWESVVGVEIANQTKAGSIRRGELEIIVANSSVMQLLSFSQNRFLEKMNEKLRNAEIRKLRFRIGSIN